MLDKFKKYFNTEKSEKEVEMAKEDAQASKSAVEMAAELASAQEALTSQASALQAATEQLTKLSADLAQAQAALTEVETAKAALAAEAKAKQKAFRKEKVEAAIGTDKADALLVATENMEDAQFEAVIAALAGSVDAEAKSAMFKEAGVAADAKPEIDPVENLAAKVAAAVAAQFKTV